MHACAYSHVVLASLQQGQTALFIAAQSNNLVAARSLLKQKADPNIADNNEDAPLHASLRLRMNAVAEVLLQDPRTMQVVNGKDATALVDPSSEIHSALLANRAATVRRRKARRKRPRHLVLDMFALTAAVAACYCISILQQFPAAVRGFFDAWASAFLLPLFTLVLIYSFRYC